MCFIKMFELRVILLISLCILLSESEPVKGIFRRKKAPVPIVRPEPEYVVKEQLVVVQEPPPPPPCKSDKCRPKPEYVENPCRTDRCRTCHNECNGNEKCHNECIVVDRCRTNCNGYEKCVNECGANRGNYYENDRCHGCQSDCPNNRPLLTHCEQGKWLYYIQVPTNITLGNFVSNADLLRLYFDSNMELNADGISGRACLNDKTRLDLNKLNAALMPIAFAQK